jgi:hypothetical protein
MGDGLSTVSNDGNSVKRLEASNASPLTSNQKLGLGEKVSDTPAEELRAKLSPGMPGSR